MVKTESFGSHNGREVFLYSLKNNSGSILKITNYGATIVSIEVPDRDGKRDNVTLGYETLDGYLNGDQYFGTVVGRYANRIANGKFEIDGVEYSLALNNGPNALHGGPGGWHSVVWYSEVVKGSNTVKFSYLSPHMEEGYPGNMTVTLFYSWTDENEVVMNYEVATDRTSILNVTNHAYFNLQGAGTGNILDHELIINASAYTPVDKTLIPTGEIRPVERTPFDFRTASPVGERIEEQDIQLIYGMGYDHNYVIDKTDGPAAIVYDPQSGRVLEVFTDLPGVQFYSGNFLDGTQIGIGGKTYTHRSGLCLETQLFPDSPNKPEFPSVIINPGTVFKSITSYKFSVRRKKGEKIFGNKCVL
jgi:aldose 1-epimerase